MQSSLSLSLPSSSSINPRSNHNFDFPSIVAKPLNLNLRFCGLRREALSFSATSRRVQVLSRRVPSCISAALSTNGSSPKTFDYDLVIIGAGVGGHGAALHAVEKVSLRHFNV